MSRVAFIGPSYRSQSVNADCQVSMNWHTESDESGVGKSAVVLYPAEGLKVEYTIKSPVRGQYRWNSRAFAVGDDTLYELFADGSLQVLGGGMANDGLPVSFAANNASQMIVCTGGQLWLFPLATTTTSGQLTNPGAINNTQIYDTTTSLGIWFTPSSLDYTLIPGATYIQIEGATEAEQFNGQQLKILNGSAGYVVVQIPASTPYNEMPDTGTVYLVSPGTQVGPVQVNSSAGAFSFVDYLDGYFVALKANSQVFVLSGLEDGSIWDPTDVYRVSEFADNVLSMKVNQELIWFFGETKSLPYYNSGDALNPITPVQNILIEQGISAANSVVKLDNSLFWLGADERGANIAWRASGYTPLRVSNHAIENEWSQYAKTSDAVGYSYQNQGHQFWVLYFPSANYRAPDAYRPTATWVYDVATNQWHQRDKWVNGVSYAHPSWCHVFQFGKHLVGDPTSGNVYDMSINYYDNAGVPIHRIRRAPHLSTEQEYIRHNELQIYLESGLGTFEGGMPVGLPSFVLPDVNGQNWTVQVNDDGTATTTETSANYGATVFQDSLNPSQFWQMSIDSEGRLVATEFSGAASMFYTTPIQMISRQGDMQATFSLQNGIIVTSTSQPQRGGQLMLRWSDDGGHTWSNYYPLDCGKVGEFKRRAIRRRLGRARDRVYEISCTDAQPWRIIDAYLKTSPGDPPQKRLAQKYADIS